MKTKIKNFINRHEINICWIEFVYPSVGISFKQFDSNFRCSGYEYALLIGLWKNGLRFTFNTFR